MSASIVILGLALILSLAIMVRKFKVLTRVSCVGTTFVTFFLMHGLSAIPYASGLMDRGWLNPRPPTEDLPFVLAASFMGYAVGALLVASGTKFDLTAAQRNFFLQRMDPLGPAPARFLVLVGTAVGLGILFTWGAGQTGVAMLASSAREGAALREFRLNFADANPYYYIGSYARSLLVPLVMLVALNMGSQGRTRWRVMGMALFVFSIVLAAASLNKAPVILMVVYLLINRALRREGADRKTGTAMVGALAVIAIGGAALYYLTYDIESTDALRSTVDRVILIPQQCLEGFLLVYPDVLPFNYGRGIGAVARLLGVSGYVSPSFAVGEYMTGETRVSSNAFWSSELWAAFGYFGVIIGSIAVGAILTWLDRWVLRRARNALSTAGYAYLVVTAVLVPSVSIFTILLSGGLGLAVPLLAWLGPDAWKARSR